MPPGPKKRRARKQQQQKQLLLQQQQQQQQEQKEEMKNEEVREEGEEEDEDEEIPSPDRQHQKLLHLQEVVKEEKEPAMVDDGDVHLSPQPEETMEACKNVSVEEAKKDDDLSFRPKETLVADNYFSADDASKIDHREEEKEGTMEGHGDEDLNIKKVEQFDQKQEERLVEDVMEARDMHDAESKLDQKEGEAVFKAQDIGDVGELMNEGQKGEEERFKAQELSEVNANVDKHSSDSVQADEDSEIKLIHVSEIEITITSSASGDDINLNQSNGESNPAGVVSVQEPEIMVVPLLEAEVELDSEPYSLVMSKPQDELVSEQQAVTVSESKVVDFTETEVDAASKPEAEVVSESKQEPETIVGFEPEAVILNLQKDSKSTVVETVNTVAIKQQPDSESSMELKSLPDLEAITKVDKSAQEKTEQPCEPDQQEATEDIVENQIKEESKLNQPSEPPKKEIQDASKVSMTEKHAKSPTKAEGETTSLVFSVADESSEISSNVREIPSSTTELKSSPLTHQEYQVREEVALSHLHHVEQENDGKTSSTFERSEKAIESEDGLVDEPSMSELDREDDAASSLIVEVGSVYAESDIQELEDSGNPPIGMEVGSFDNRDFTSRPGSPNMNAMCLEEQDNGETPYVEQQYFSEEKAEFPQENFEPVEAGEMVVKDLAKPNVTEDIMAYDVSGTANPHESAPVHVNDYCKLEETKYTILENGGHKDGSSLKIGHRNNDVADGADVDIALDSANKLGKELGDSKLISAAMRNEEEVKTEMKEANISYGKWKQAAILPEESIEAWDEKREIVNTVTPVVSNDHPVPTGSLKSEEDSSGEKAAIEFTKEESHLTVVPNHKERCTTTEFVKEKNAQQSDGARTMTRRSNWFGCCGMLDLLMSKDR